MSKIHRGDIAELMVMLEAEKQGIKVSIPFSNDTRYDFVFGVGNKLFKIQVKRAYIKKERGKNILCVDSRRFVKSNQCAYYSNGDYDYFIAVDVDNKAFWIMDFDSSLKKSQFRLNDPNLEKYFGNWEFKRWNQ